MRAALIALGWFLGPAFGGNIYGKDDREPLEVSGPPWTAIGRLEREDGGFCTGSVVGPDILLTAAHCVLDEGGRPYRGIVFRAFQRLDASAAEVGVKACRDERTCRVGSRRYRQDFSGDWALVRLERAISGDTGTLPVRPLETIDEKTLRDTPIISVGYSEQVLDGLVPVVERGCRIRASFRPHPALFDDCDIWKGMSGGPLLVPDERASPVIIAINIKGDEARLESYSHETANVAVDAATFAPALQALLTQGWDR